MMLRFLSICIALLALSACSIVPVPLSEQELTSQASASKEDVTKDQTPVTGPISLYESIARSIKYNLDFQLEFYEKILAENDLDITRYEMLPQLITRTGYDGRNNFSGSSSRSLLNGTQSLALSTSTDRDVLSSDLRLTWNILDFGVSYFRAKQAGEKILIAEEEKRRVLNRIVQDVRTAYWRAVSNDRLIAKIEKLLVRVNKAISESKEVESKLLDRPLTALTYQRELIGIKRELEELQRDLSLAKIQLAALMNLRPGEEYELIIPDRAKILDKLDISPDILETLALENRPELREIAYEKRINKHEAKAAILGLMPGLDLSFGKNYNSNSFLFNNNWLTYGAQVSWNLLNVFKYPVYKKQIEAKDKVLDAQKLALSMAIMTQVHVSLAQYEHSLAEYTTASQYYAVQKKILNQLKSGVAAKSVTEQSLIREEMNMMVAEIKYDIAYSDVENAYASIISAIGIDPMPFDADTDSVGSFTESIKNYFDNLTLNQQIFSLKVQQVETEDEQ